MGLRSRGEKSGRVLAAVALSLPALAFGGEAEWVESLTHAPRLEWLPRVHKHLMDDPDALTAGQLRGLAETLSQERSVQDWIGDYRAGHYDGHPDETWWYYLARLDADDLAVRREAAAALGWIQYGSLPTPAFAKVIRALAARLEDPDAEVRRHAAHALGGRVASRLSSRLQEPEVPGLAEEVWQALTRHLERTPVGQPAESVDAARAWGTFAALMSGKAFDRAVGALLAKLEDPGEGLRLAAVQALGALYAQRRGDCPPEVLPALLSRLDEPRFREAVLYQLECVMKGWLSERDWTEVRKALQPRQENRCQDVLRTLLEHRGSPQPP